ncbi:NifU family protein [bacterium]|nr:NifU family protein [bacterium]
MSDQDIKIMAEPQMDPEKCLFNLEKPLYPNGGSFTFSSKEEAKGSALAEAILNVEQVVSVFISPTSLMVQKQGYDNWRTVGPQIGKAIRETVKSGKDIISPEKFKSLPDVETLKVQVIKVIEERVNPAVASHGGFIELVDVKANDIYIKMGGGCQGCASSTATLKQGVERTLRTEIPSLGQIIDATDHASGANPYFQH